MREIKFRAWNGKEMCRDFVTFNNKFGYTVEQIMNFGAIAMMQYTGLKDNNGIDIYEGDIVKLQNQYRPSGISRFKQDQLFEIQFIDGYTYCRNIEYNEQAKYYYGAELYKIHNKCEVIGNIYENPELLEQK